MLRSRSGISAVLLGVTAMGLHATGCSSSFDSCEEARTCPTTPAAEAGQGGQDSNEPRAGQASGGDPAQAGGSTGEGGGSANEPGGSGGADAGVSDDASLRSLSLGPATLAPDFDAGTLEYTASFAYFEPHLTLEAEPSATDAVMTYDGEPFVASDAIELSPTPEDDLAQVSVEVTAASGEKQSYEVALERRALTTTYVKAFNSRKDFTFGTSVAIDGTTAVFGAPAEDSGSSGVDSNESSTGYIQAGAAYVAVRGANGKWARQAYLKASITQSGDNFGAAVAIDGDTIAVGAPGDDGYEGAVYVFVRSGNTWSEQAVLVEPGERQNSVNFGSAVALRGDRVVVSAPASGSQTYQGGAVYAFNRTGTQWAADTSHPNPPKSHFQTYDGYGYRLSLDGNRVAVSEWQGERAVFIMLRDASAWSLEDSIELPSEALANSKVALDGNTLAVTAPGVVHVYTRSGSEWSKQVSLTAFDAAAAAGFGSAVALSGDLLAVGSGCEDCAGGISTFVRAGSTWKDGAYIVTENLDAADQLGSSLALSGTRLVAGAPGEDSNSTSFNQTSQNNGALLSGAAFIFE